MPKKLSPDEREARLGNPVARYLNRAFLAWQASTGFSQSQRDFADYLGLGNATVGKLMRGEVGVPETATLDKIAAKLGGDIYDVVGVERPDKVRQFVLDNWGKLDVDTVAEINRIVERALSRAGKAGARRGLAISDRR